MALVPLAMTGLSGGGGRSERERREGMVRGKGEGGLTTLGDKQVSIIIVEREKRRGGKSKS